MNSYPTTADGRSSRATTIPAGIRHASMAIAAAVNARTMSVIPLNHQLVQDHHAAVPVDAERERVRREAARADQQDPAGDPGGAVVTGPDRLGDETAVPLLAPDQPAP